LVNWSNGQSGEAERKEPSAERKQQQAGGSPLLLMVDQETAGEAEFEEGALLVSH
jgi:hypothetical protein